MIESQRPDRDSESLLRKGFSLGALAVLMIMLTFLCMALTLSGLAMLVVKITESAAGAYRL